MVELVLRETNYNNTNYEKLLGLPNNFGFRGSPQITGFNGAWQGTQGSYGIHQIISNLDENLTKIAGKHQIQFGGRYRHERFGYQTSVRSDAVAFSSTATSLNNPATCPSCTTLGEYGHRRCELLYWRCRQLWPGKAFTIRRVL